MDSFEWNKIIGAVLGTAIFIFVVRLVAEKVYEPEKPAKPGYVVEGVVETPAGGGAAAPVEEALPDWGTVLAKADVAAGKTTFGQVRAVPRHSAGRDQQDRPGAVWRGRPHRAPRVAGFDYSAAMKAKGGSWTYDELFKFIKSPGAYIPGTKMCFAGLSKAEDRINLIAFLRTNAAVARRHPGAQAGRPVARAVGSRTPPPAPSPPRRKRPRLRAALPRPRRLPPTAAKTRAAQVGNKK